MSISPNTQAILLLTSHFSKVKEGAVKPLTPNEWGRFAYWLKEKSLTPEQLMTGRLDELMKGWSDKTITLDRAKALIERRAALALATEKWLRAGLWIMPRSDPDYPVRLKQRLGRNSPSVLFGCGDKSLLNGENLLAVVGSRNASNRDLAYSRGLGVLAASKGYSIVSGGARGVDEASMLGALEADGTVIGVLANGLLQNCSSAKYRKYLMKNNLVLVSTFYPEAGFNAGNAMQRNKYIYCLSNLAIVVQSGIKGGTQSGAMENLKKNWVPLWVKRTTDELAGNSAIVKEGARWVSENIGDVDIATLESAKIPDRESGEDLFDQAISKNMDKEGIFSRSTALTTKPDTVMENESISERENLATKMDAEDFDLYDLFLIMIKAKCSETPKTSDELVDALDIHKTQLNIWLKRSVKDGNLKKLSKPVRYQWIVNPKDLFTLK